MKLPEDPAEKKKVIAVIVMGSIAVIYGCYIGIVKPLRHKRQLQIEMRANLEKNLRLAEIKVGNIGRDRTENLELAREIDEIANRHDYVPMPRHGNYFIGAKAVFEEIAAEAGLELETLQEAGITELPKPAGQPVEHAFRSYSLRATVRCGIYELARLMETIETGNPYACVSRLSIGANSQDPTRLVVGFDIQLPVWKDPSIPRNISEQVARQESEQKAERNGAAETAAPPAEESGGRDGG